MSKRNFILFVIVLVILALISLGYLYFNKPQPKSVEIEEVNFGSPFGLFNTTPSSTPSGETPADISGYQPETTSSALQTGAVLRKISSMPIAGYTLFNKERLIDLPTTPDTTTETYNFGTATIKVGVTGEAVKDLQKFLNIKLGLSLTVDGVINTETISAIKIWQENNNLTADGIVGQKTKSAMYASVPQTPPGEPIPPPTETVLALRYVDRASGNIYQTFVDTIEERKFSTTIIPQVYEALFGNNGNSVIMRYLKEDGQTIETFIGTLPKEILGGDTTASYDITGTFLPENIRDLVLSPDTKNLFYLFESGGGIIGSMLNFTTNKKTQAFDSLFTEWLSQWPNDKTITLTTKPSYLAPGYMYTKNPSAKNLTQVLNNIIGLTTLASPDGKMVLYANNNLSLNLYYRDTRKTEPVGVKTLPEKCFWENTNTTIYCFVPKIIENSNQYPDVWYQGEESFSDQIWEIDTETGNATMLIDPAAISGGEEIDGIDLSTDKERNYLFFVNKKDSHLWSFNLK